MKCDGNLIDCVFGGGIDDENNLWNATNICFLLVSGMFLLVQYKLNIEDEFIM